MYTYKIHVYTYTSKACLSLCTHLYLYIKTTVEGYNNGRLNIRMLAEAPGVLREGEGGKKGSVEWGTERES